MQIRQIATNCMMLLTVLCACGPRVPSSDQGDDASTPDLPPPTDLPCGGADLMTDNANCGTCGNECIVRFEGSQWEAGGCIDGVCAPTWESCIGEQIGFNSCVDVCEFFDGTCIEGGCTGNSGLMVAVPWFGGCDPTTDIVKPVATCSEPLVFVEDDETQDHIICCCLEP